MNACFGAGSGSSSAALEGPLPARSRSSRRQCPTVVDKKGVGPHFIHDLVKRVDPESSFRATPETSRLRISLRR